MTVQKVASHSQTRIGQPEDRPRGVQGERVDCYLSHNVGCPPLMMIAMSWLGWFNRWHGKKANHEEAESIPPRQIIPTVIANERPPVAPPFVCGSPDPLSCARYGASDGTIGREGDLRRRVGREDYRPVYIVAAEQQLAELLSYFRIPSGGGASVNVFDKYVVVDRGYPSTELRVASDHHGIAHKDMFRPDFGEKLVAAGYWSYMLKDGELRVDGKSVDFPTLESCLVPNRRFIAQGLVANNAGMKHVRAMMTLRFPTIPMKFISG